MAEQNNKETRIEGGRERSRTRDGRDRMSKRHHPLHSHHRRLSDHQFQFMKCSRE
jgi:hypothetical protein